jgi:hypothetical protein
VGWRHLYRLSVSGLLNIVTRPLGGYIGDVIYQFYGTRGKKAWIILCGLIMGATFLAGGLYIQSSQQSGDTSRMFLSPVKEYLLIANFFRSPDCYGYILCFYYLLPNGERWLFCPRTSLSSQRALFVAFGCWT